MKKIDFKQPKYILPLVILLPVLFLGYTVCSLFSGDDNETVTRDGLQTELPEAQTKDVQDKYTSMYGRFDMREDDGYTAISSIGKDTNGPDTLESVYTEEEKARFEAEAEARRRQEQQMRQLQESMANARRGISGDARNRASGNRYTDNYEEERGMAEYAAQIQAMQAAQKERQQMLAKALGLDPEKEEQKEKPGDTVPSVEPIEPPLLVLKSKETNADRFNTIGNAAEKAEASLIRAMIDKTTKAHQGTRLRFKLLDDVTVRDIKLKKGTYLYGTVTGFGQQRVMASITSIMVNGKFLKVDLSVFDNDGMEGFYVPESAFRDFMKNAGSGVAQQNINISSGGYGSEISGEALALQALQNVYNSASQAVAANIRKNRAKIKYNTVVYLINSQMAQ